MNDDELDAIARRSAQSVRHEALRIADGSSALRHVLNRDDPASTTEVVDITPAVAPNRGRLLGWWMVAACVVAVIVGGALAWSAGNDGAIAPADTPPNPPADTGPVATVAVTTTVITVSSAQPAPPTPPPTAPPSTVATTVPQPAGDPMAEWSPPAVGTPTLDDVPRLIPDPTLVAPGRMSRSEFAGATEPGSSFTQAWVRTAADGTIDGRISLNSFAGPPTTDGFVPVEIGGGWNKAYLGRSGNPEIKLLTVVGDTGTVQLSADGMTTDEMRTLASGLRFSSIGWSAPDLAGWIDLGGAWLTAGGGRWMYLFPAPGELQQMEIGIGLGFVTGSFGPPIFWGEPRLIQIDDRPALVLDDGSKTTVLWKPTHDTIVFVGTLNDSGLDAEQIARSMHAVDQQTWEGFSTVFTTHDDGCLSLYC